MIHVVCSRIIPKLSRQIFNRSKRCRQVGERLHVHRAWTEPQQQRKKRKCLQKNEHLFLQFPSVAILKTICYLQVFLGSFM